MKSPPSDDLDVRAAARLAGRTPEILVRLDDALLDRAADLDPTELRSLDSIHLAAAASLGDDLAAVVSSDERLLATATSLGLPTATPS